MSNEISETRVEQILEAYGADPRNWPEAERNAAINCIEKSVSLQAQKALAAELDDVLRAHAAQQVQTVDTSVLQKNILASISDQATTIATEASIFSRFFTWLLQPAVMATTALAGVTLLAVLVLNSGHQTALPANEAFEQWAWLDITDNNLQQETESLDSMMDLVELEIDDNG